MLNRTEFIESFLAANKLGAIAVPVNFRMTPPEIAFLVSDCDAKVVITESVLASVATAVRDLDADAGHGDRRRARPPKTASSATTTCSPRTVSPPRRSTSPTTRPR